MYSSFGYRFNFKISELLGNHSCQFTSRSTAKGNREFVDNIFSAMLHVSTPPPQVNGKTRFKPETTELDMTTLMQESK